MMLTPSLIWKDFVASAELNVSSIRKYEEDNIEYNEVYFSARAMCDGVTRVFGIFATPKDLDKHAAILYCPNVGEMIDIDIIKSFAKIGYAVLGVDYCGERDDGSRFTIYPKSLDYANFVRSGRHLTYVDSTAQETTWYEWTVVARYAVKFLTKQTGVDAEKIGVIGIREGGYFAWQLSSFCAEVKAGVSLFEGGWREYDGKYKYSDDNEIDVDEEREKWIAGISTQVYAMHVKTPFLYMGATNDKLGNCDRVADTLLRLDKSRTYYAFAPNMCNHITKTMFHTIEKFLEKFLGGSGIKFNAVPTVNISVANKSTTVYISCAEQPKLYISFNEANSVLRYWQEVKVQPCEVATENGSKYNYMAEIVVYEKDTLLSAIAACTFSSGEFLTSLVATTKLIGKDIAYRPLEKQRMIYGGAKTPLDFVAISSNLSTNDSSCIVVDQPVSIEPGAFDVMGACAIQGSLATFKLGDRRFEGGVDSILKFDIFAQTEGKLIVKAVSNYLSSDCTIYAMQHNVVGGELWQKVEVPRSMLKSGGDSPSSWQKIDCIIFEFNGKMLVTNLLWL